MEKELENPEKKKRIKQPSRPKSAQPGHAPAPSDRRTPPISGSSPSRAPSLPHSVPSGADLSVPVPPPHTLSLSRGPGSLVAEPLPRAPLSSLSASWVCHVSSAPSTLVVDRRVRTRARRRISRPRLPPTRPAPFLEPPSAPRSPLASFCTLLPSLALCPRLQTPPETRARVPGHPARRRSLQASPSSALR
jgi:hypothetical protein